MILIVFLLFYFYTSCWSVVLLLPLSFFHALMVNNNIITYFSVHYIKHNTLLLFALISTANSGRKQYVLSFNISHFSLLNEFPFL